MAYAIALGLAALGLELPRVARAQDLRVKIIALNDLHGNLQSPGQLAANAQSSAVPVGGADYLAAYVAHLKSENPLNTVVSAGDLTGGGPLVSALFHDEDTIEAMNLLGLEINAVGNHEFDQGKQELLRKQHGGCFNHDPSACKGATFKGAKFQYLAANVYVTSTGKRLFPAYAIKTYDGVKVAFIGLTLKDTPTIVTSTGVAGLRFTDEATAINTTVRQLRRQGIQSFVVLIHQGSSQTTKGTKDINACEGGLNVSSIEAIVNKLDDAVDLVLSAHSHQAYICQVSNSAGRKITVTQASAYGRMLTDIDLTLDRKTKRIVQVSARNLLVDRTNPEIVPAAVVASLVDRYVALAAPTVNRVVGTIAAEITRTMSPASENAMGDLIADAQLEATSAPTAGGAVAAFMNEGGIRIGLAYASATPGVPDGAVTYGELFTAQPFSNKLVTMTLTGAQIKTLLEEQFKGCALGIPAGADVPSGIRQLQVSEGFSYAWTASAAPCEKIAASTIKIRGVTVVPSANYRVTVNSLLADGGEQFYVLKQGTGRLVGSSDMDAMVAYFAKHPSVAPAQLNRISIATPPN